RRAIPVVLAFGRGSPLLAQTPADLGQRAALLADPGKDLPHDACFLPPDFIPRLSTSGPLPDVAVTVRATRQHVHAPPLGRMALATPAALEDLGPLVLGHHALHLQQQVIFGGASEFAIEEDQFYAAALELVHQQNLIRVFASQTIGRVNVEAIDGTIGRRIPQLLQRWAHQRTTTVAFVEEAQLGIQRQTITPEAFFQRGDLAGNGTRLSVLIGRDAGINRRSNGIHRLLHAESPPWAMGNGFCRLSSPWERCRLGHARRQRGTARSEAAATRCSSRRERSQSPPI